MHTLQHIHGGNLTAAQEKFGIERDKFVDFSANINPLGPSPKALAAVAANLSAVSSYPDPDCKELTLALAEYLQLPAENILFGNGATELIYLLIDVFKYRKALVAAPTFSEYSLAVLTREGQLQEVLLQEEQLFSLPVESIIKNLPEVEIVFICNPNNPTGLLTTRENIIQIVDAAAEYDCMVVIDEAFMDFVAEGENFSVIQEAKHRQNLIVLYSLTKYFGIPGLRLGAMAACNAVIEKVKAAKDPWSVNMLAQIAGVVSLQDHEYIRDTKKLVAEERNYLFQSLNEIPGIKVFPGTANFLLLKLTQMEFPVKEYLKRLGKIGILVRDCSSFNGLGDNFFRVAVKSRKDNELLVRAFKELQKGIFERGC